MCSSIASTRSEDSVLLSTDNTLDTTRIHILLCVHASVRVRRQGTISHTSTNKYILLILMKIHPNPKDGSLSLSFDLWRISLIREVGKFKLIWDLCPWHESFWFLQVQFIWVFFFFSFKEHYETHLYRCRWVGRLLRCCHCCGRLASQFPSVVIVCSLLWLCL